MKAVTTFVGMLALTASCVTGEAAGPALSISRPPAALHVGEEWTATVRARTRPQAFVIRQGRRVQRFPLTRSGTRYRASVAFPRAGRWRYGVRVGGRDRLVGSVLVRPAVPDLRQPYGIVEEPAGTLLVADFAENAVLRLNASTGEGSRVARVPRPRDLRATSGGRLLVSSGPNVLELDPRTGTVTVRARAAGDLEGIAQTDDGGLYLVEDQARIVRIGPDGSRSLLADGLNGVHGILPTRDGVLVCESFAGSVRLVTATGMETLASGLGNPSYLAQAPNRGVYVTEFAANRVSRIDPSGTVEAIAPVGQPGPITVDREGRLLVGTLGGEIHRIDASTRRVTRIWPRR